METERVKNINVDVKISPLGKYNLLADLCILAGFGNLVHELQSDYPSPLSLYIYGGVLIYGIAVGILYPSNPEGVEPQLLT